MDINEALGAVARDRRGWDGAAGYELLREAERVLSPIASQMRRTTMDAVMAAWSLWESWGASVPDKINDPWAYTAYAVRAALLRERLSEQQLTSPNRAIMAAEDQPVMCGLIEAITEARPHDRHCDDERLPPALASIVGWLVEGGADASTALAAISVIADRSYQSVNLPSASDRLIRDRHLPAALGIPAPRWRALVRLTVGDSRGSRRGLVEVTAHQSATPREVRALRRDARRVSEWAVAA